MAADPDAGRISRTGEYRAQMRAASGAAGVRRRSRPISRIRPAVAFCMPVKSGMARAIIALGIACAARSGSTAARGGLFSDRRGGYIYRRYQRTGIARWTKAFFRLLWSERGYRTEWIDAYCETGRRTALPAMSAA